MKDFSKILKYAKPYTKSIVFAFFCLVLSSLITLLLPLIVRTMINAVVVLAVRLFEGAGIARAYSAEDLPEGSSPRRRSRLAWALDHLTNNVSRTIST